MRAGLLLGLCTAIAFIPHISHFYQMGRYFYLSETTEILLYLAAGIVTGFIAGKEKKLREKYQDISEKLERSYKKLHEETEVLIEVEEQLRASQKLSALGKLSASLAHEIKNPLASIRGTAEIFLDEFPPDHPKREFVEILLKEAERLNNTVDEVLRFSRRQQDAPGKQPKLEPLLDTITRVATLLENKLYRKGIRLHTDIDDSTAEFLVDGDKMSQVLINLLLNSFEAVGKQGRIWLTVEPRERRMAITVADDGPGIPENDREIVFTPFYSKREEGTGLGLAISSRIVESYGGRIQLDSRPGGGARFTILLPLKRETDTQVPLHE
ncbi:MAG: ATP-binding protein [Desulfobulbaceae bacterium]|nr:ATP-binding protein [Desulfobulbaceae bacterium]